MIKSGKLGFAIIAVVAALAYILVYVPVLWSTDSHFTVNGKMRQFVNDYKEGRLYVSSRLSINSTLDSPAIKISFYLWPGAVPKSSFILNSVIVSTENQSKIYSLENIKLDWLQLGNGQYRSSFTGPKIADSNFEVYYQFQPCKTCEPIAGKANYKRFKRTTRYTIAEFFVIFLSGA